MYAECHSGCGYSGCMWKEVPLTHLSAERERERVMRLLSLRCVSTAHGCAEYFIAWLLSPHTPHPICTLHPPCLSTRDGALLSISLSLSLSLCLHVPPTLSTQANVHMNRVIIPAGRFFLPISDRSLVHTERDPSATTPHGCTTIAPLQRWCMNECATHTTTPVGCFPQSTLFFPMSSLCALRSDGAVAANSNDALKRSAVTRKEHTARGILWIWRELNKRKKRRSLSVLWNSR